MPKFPETPFQTPSAVAALAGSYWTGPYGDSDTIEHLLSVAGETAQTTQQELLVTADCLSRDTVPVYRREAWYPLVLKESERNGQRVGLLRYDEGAVYDNQPNGVLYQYDIPYQRNDHNFPAPTGLQTCYLVTDQLLAPTLTLVHNQDFLLDARKGVLTFRENPFDNPALLPELIFTAGEVTDRYLTLWLYQPEFQWEAMYELFGYVLGLYLPNSSGYKRLVNALFDALVGGSARSALYETLSAMTGIPLAAGNETVEQVYEDPDALLIVTDRACYRFVAEATPLVAVGDKLRRGQSLVDGLTIHELNRGELPDSVPAIAVPQGMLGPAYSFELTFINQEQPTTIGADKAGNTTLQFPIGGFPLDVDRFWEDVHARGLASGRTLAQYLDTRTNQEGQPGPSNLPAVINPAKFLTENLLRNNVTLVQIAGDQFGEDAAGLVGQEIFRRLIPPWATILLLLQLPALTDSPGSDSLEDALPDMLEVLDLLEDTSPLPSAKLFAPYDVSYTCQ